MTETLHIECKAIDKSAILRALRALAGIDQREAAALTGLSLRTIAYAESGQCSAKAWDKLATLYATRGARLVAMPTIAGTYAPMIAIDKPASQLAALINPTIETGKKKRRANSRVLGGPIRDV